MAGRDRMAGHDAGHRILPHAADLIVEAWAATPEECITEAVGGLVAGFADVSGAQPGSQHDFRVRAGSWEQRLIEVLEEAIFLLDTRGQVPISVSISSNPGGSLAVAFGVAPVEDTEPAGSGPKGIARSGLEFAPNGDQWRCKVIVDV